MNKSGRYFRLICAGKTLPLQAHFILEKTAGFLHANDPELVESAVLALGDSSAPEPLEQLLKQYEDWVLFDQRCLLIRVEIRT